MKLVASTAWAEQPEQPEQPDPVEPIDITPHREQDGEDAAPALPSGETTGPVVLFATRKLQQRAFGAAILQKAGFRVEAETHGDAVLTAVERLQPDLILTEPELDDMKSAYLVARIRELTPDKTVPVLVISDHPDSAEVREVLTEDFTDFITPPVNWKFLPIRIQRWIGMAKKFRALSDHELVDLEQVRDSAVKASTELLQLRNYDSITGLPNREMFLSTTEWVLSQNHRSSGTSAVLYLDIDDFKGVNDLIGRSLGDELLRIVAKRLQGCLREDDLVSQASDEGSMTSFARLHGDQFAILLSSVHDRNAAAAVAQRLLKKLAEPLTIRKRQFRLAARIGIADTSNLDVEESEGQEELLVQQAETAMRYCKQGKGQPHAFFEGFMNELVLKKLELKAEIRQAIDKEELFLCYQLLVDSRTSAPTGVEGLVRWQHPTRGLVPPNDFLPVAEESDLIVEIDRWVLRAGCRQGKAWLDEGHPPLLMSLNVSMRFLEQEDFARQILEIVEDSGLPPALLQLELSERGTLPDAGRIMAQFDLLVSEGIQLALDDFGTGQTSLSYLRTLPITCVKVDQSFIKRTPDDSASVAIVTAIVAMSHHLGLKVVAEGVETEEHWQFLFEKDYDQLQGYLFAKPQPVDELVQTFKALCDRSTRTPRWTPVLPATTLTQAGNSPAAEAEVPATVPQVVSAGPVPATNVPAAHIRVPEPASGGSIIQVADQPATPPLPSAETPAIPDGQSEEHYLLQLARKDFLTKLYNRFSFDERLEHAAAHADRFDHKLALLLLDLDDFKYVNDTYGHAVGDGLLKAIAARLAKLIRKVDTLARIGGDEFAVILSEFHDVRNVAELAGRLLSELARPVVVEGRELRVTGSLGISVYPSADAQTKDLLRQADLALYKAKNRGGHAVRFFGREMDREVQQRLALTRDLTGAVDRGELFIEYQQQVALDTGKVVGVEALVRWNHPERGVIGPSSFIPIAESTGEILAIGRWVTRSACAQARKWQLESGRGVPVSVNLSPVQCRDPRFVETILKALKEHELAPELLVLELDERLLERLPQDLENTLRGLSELGVSLALDNFGSGASALEHFQRFRFDRLKVHQSLVRKIGSCHASSSVFSGIVTLARKMGSQIIAEGIEKRAEVEGLLAEGCTVGQGFLFSKPLSADAISELLSRQDAAGGDAAPELLPTIESVIGESDEPRESAEPSAVQPADTKASEPLRAAQPPDPAPRVPETEPEPKTEELEGEPTRPQEALPPALHSPSPGGAAAAAAAAGAEKWRAHALLAIAAVLVWGLALWPRGATQSEAPTTLAPITKPATVVAEPNVQEPSALPVEPPAPAPTPAPALQPQPPIASQVPARPPLELAKAWARAWSEQRVDDYLGFYAAEFRPPHRLDHAAWEAQRRTKILGARDVQVTLSAFDAELIDTHRARVSFDQAYSATGYSDSVRKTLELTRRDGGWQIVRERVDGPS